jgi:hypothetical protein
MTQWEYCFIDIIYGTIYFYHEEEARLLKDVMKKDVPFIQSIAFFGRDGWELVSVSMDGSKFYFKRPIMLTVHMKRHE